MINKTKINEAIQLFGFKSYEDFAIMPLQGINRMLKISKEEDSFETISSNNSRLITKFARLQHFCFKS
jgi:hypothetical protein